MNNVDLGGILNRLMDAACHGAALGGVLVLLCILLGSAPLWLPFYVLYVLLRHKFKLDF